KKTFQQGREALEAAVAIFQDNDHPGEAIACLAVLCQIFGGISSYPEMQKLSDEALALSNKLDNHLYDATILRALAATHRDQKRLNQALPLAEAALNSARKIGDIAGEASSLQLLGFIQFDLGQQEEGLQNLRQALDISEAIGFDRLTWDVALDVLNMYFRTNGDYQGAIAFLDKRIAIAQGAKEKSHQDMLLLAFRYNKMELCEYMGLYTEALEVSDKFVPTARKLGIQPRRGLSWTYRIRAQLGDPDEPPRLLEQILEIEPDSFHLLFNAAFVAWISPNSADWPKGLAWAQAATQIVQELGEGFHIELAFALDLTARLYLALGQIEEALSHMKELMQLAKIDPRLYGHEQFNFTYYNVLCAAGHPEEADEALKRAYAEVSRVAEKITDETLRRSWLAAVPYNRAIMTEAEARGVTDSNT
ncbi:MAG: tetratricopeptide repeat protein, partial [Chloroflexota bacterium]